MSEQGTKDLIQPATEKEAPASHGAQLLALINNSQDPAEAAMVAVRLILELLEQL